MAATRAAAKVATRWRYTNPTLTRFGATWLEPHPNPNPVGLGRGLSQAPTLTRFGAWLEPRPMGLGEPNGGLSRRSKPPPLPAASASSDLPAPGACCRHRCPCRRPWRHFSLSLRLLLVLRPWTSSVSPCRPRSCASRSPATRLHIAGLWLTRAQIGLYSVEGTASLLCTMQADRAYHYT